MEKQIANAAVRFAADRMLGRLARWLRLLGADVIDDPTIDGSKLLARARREGRVTLTRDKRLRTAPDVVCLGSNDFREQIGEVMRRCPFDSSDHAFTRCSRCNTVLSVVPKQAIGAQVPPFVYASHERFARCGGCGRIYWDETHRTRAVILLNRMGVGNKLAPEAAPMRSRG